MSCRRFVCIFCVLMGLSGPVPAQELVHSHNDYTHAAPFRAAYRARVASMEADVFPVAGRLRVSHTDRALASAPTLDSLYIRPIVQLFRAHDGQRVSADPHYTFYLMIDIKRGWQQALPIIIRLLNRYPACFDRKVNPLAVQIFISGDRPPDTSFHRYPGVIMFDGLPGVSYRPADLDKLAMISTNFDLYSHWDGKGTLPGVDRARLRAVIRSAHALSASRPLPVRFWGAPDTKNCWKTLMDLGARVINTDEVDAVMNFLKKEKK